MERYESLGVVGEGSYGVVLKCRNRETGQIVAVKKFLECDDDATVKKIALREVRMLKKVRHENLVNLIESFRRKRRLYLVFEYVDHTVLDELETAETGLECGIARSHIYQVIRGIAYCHQHQIIHRDVKPENVLVSRLGVVKLCDFGFARVIEGADETCTDYVATRWYRAPELLVGDTKYGREVDIWAVGCLLAEILSGDPLFPGESDIDQLFHIIQTLGELTESHQRLFFRNPTLSGLRLPNAASTPLAKSFPKWCPKTLVFITECLDLKPERRPSAEELLNHAYFTHDAFPDKFLPELRKKVQQEFAHNLLSQPLVATRKGSGQGEKKSKKGKNEVSDNEPAKNTSKVQSYIPKSFTQKSTTVGTATPPTLTNPKPFTASPPTLTNPEPFTPSPPSLSNPKPFTATPPTLTNPELFTATPPTLTNHKPYIATNPTLTNPEPFTNPPLIPTNIHTFILNNNTPSNQPNAETSTPTPNHPNNLNTYTPSFTQTYDQSPQINATFTPTPTTSTTKQSTSYSTITSTSTSNRFNIFPFNEGPISIPFTQITPLKEQGYTKVNVTTHGPSGVSTIYGSAVKNCGHPGALSLHVMSSPKGKLGKDEKPPKSSQPFWNQTSNLRPQNFFIKGYTQNHTQPSLAESPRVLAPSKEANSFFHLDTNYNVTAPISPFSRHNQFDYSRHPYAISLDRTKDVSGRDFNRDPLREIRDNDRDPRRDQGGSIHTQDNTRIPRRDTTGWAKSKLLNEELYLPTLFRGHGKPNSSEKASRESGEDSAQKDRRTRQKRTDLTMPFLGDVERSSASSNESIEASKIKSNFPFV